ncbi:MAG: protease modulator HflC [Candidatus Eiseniibacteriota bacterium]
MSGTRLGVAILALFVAIIGLSSVFTVNESEQTLVLQFGEVKRLVTDSGLHFKLPLIQNTVYYERRVLDYDARSEEMPTRDQKQIVVNAFARYRIIDPLKFFQTVRDEQGMDGQLRAIINASLRDQLTLVDLATVLTPERANLMHRVAERVRREGYDFGVDVLDVRFKRVDLPEENSQAIYRRMQTQREQEARRIRAQGDKDSRTIRADADKQVRVIKAEANKRADILRGEGDGQAQKIYNQAYGKDPSFFDFWATMNSYRDSLDKDNTRYIGPADGDFFRFFGDENGRDKSAPAKGGSSGPGTAAVPR